LGQDILNGCIKLLENGWMQIIDVTRKTGDLERHLVISRANLRGSAVFTNIYFTREPLKVFSIGSDWWWS